MRTQRPATRLLPYLLPLLFSGCGSPGQPVTATDPEPDPGTILEHVGALAEGDVLVGEAFADHYEVTVRAGDRIMVGLTSTEFDPVLEIVPPGGGALVNDDWQGDRQRSRIDFVAAAAGVLKIRVSSYAPGATGAYRVGVQRMTAGEPQVAQAQAAQVTAMLGAGQRLEGHLTPTDPTLSDGAFYDQIVVEVAPGRPVELRVAGVEGGAPRVEVMDPRGRSLRAAASGTFSLAEAGNHRVLVAAAAAGQQGRYTAEARALDGATVQPSLSRTHHQPPPSGSGQLVTVGQRLTGEISGNDTRLPTGEHADVYEVDIQAGSHLSFEMASEALDSYLLVLGPGGLSWENDDAGGTRNAALSLTLPVGGRYRVVATTYRAGETGRYELKVLEDARVIATPTDPAAPATGGANRMAGALSPGDAQLQSGEYVDRHTFVWQAGQQVRISAQSGQFDTYLIVRTPSGALQYNDDVSDGDTNSLLAMRVTESGPHVVAVTSYRPGEAGDYQLSIEGGGSVSPQGGGARAPAGWQRIAGSLSQGDQTLQSGEFVDAHEFEWPAGQAVHLEALSTEFDTYLLVQGPSGGVQHNDDRASGDTNAALDMVTTEAGRYQVRVTSYRPGESGGYELLVGGGGASNAPAPPDAPDVQVTAAGAVEPGHQIRGRLARGDRVLGDGELADDHSLSFAPGQSVRLSLTSTDFDTYLIVRTPQGRQVDNDDIAPGNLSSAIDFPRTEAGEYRVTVTSYSGGETGRYELAVQAGPSVPGPAPVGAPVAAPGTGGRVFGVFAGITDYPAGVGDLAECANDAIKLAQTLRQQGLLTEDRQVLLTDAQVTRDNLRAAMANMAQRVRPDDVFVFFYSGHGGRGEQGSQDEREIDGADEYLYVYDGQLLDDEMGRMFDAIGARVSLLALDACYAGGFAKDVITEPGRMGLFSSEEDVTSAVAGAFQAGGYLSHFLRTGISGEADNDPHDSVLTVGELTHYLTLQFGQHVTNVRMSEGYQHLVVDRGAVGSNHILWAYQ